MPNSGGYYAVLAVLVLFLFWLFSLVSLDTLNEIEYSSHLQPAKARNSCAQWRSGRNPAARKKESFMVLVSRFNLKINAGHTPQKAAILEHGALLEVSNLVIPQELVHKRNKIAEKYQRTHYGTTRSLQTGMQYWNHDIIADYVIFHLFVISFAYSHAYCQSFFSIP